MPGTAGTGAGNIGHLIATIGADITQLRADMAAATQLIQDASDKISASAKKAANEWEKTGKKMKQAGKWMSLAITTPLIAAGTYAFKQASDSAEWLNRVQVAFQNSARSVEEFSTTTLKSIGLASNTTMEYTGMIGDMATSMGLGRAEAAKLAIGMVDLAGDMSSLKNKEIGQVMEALTGIFTGQIRPLRALGVIMTVAAIKTYMLHQGITKMYKDLTQAELIMIRYNYILSVTKNSQGDFARTFNLAANQMRLFGQNLKEVALSFGNELLPMILPVIVKLNELQTWIVGLDAPTKRLILVVGGLVAVLGPLLLVLGYMIVNVFPGIAIALKGIGVALTWVNGLILANPYVALAAAIVAVAAAVYLWTTRMTELEKIQKKANEAAEQATESLKQEQAAKAVSIKLAMEYKQGSEGRIRALNKINTIYPELLENLDTETVTNEQLNKVLEKVNTSYREKIKLAAQESKRNSIFEEQVNQQKEIDRLTTKRIELEEKLSKALETDANLERGMYNPEEMNRFIAATRAIFNIRVSDDVKFQIIQVEEALKRAEEKAELLNKELGKMPNPIITTTVNGWLSFTKGINDAILTAIALADEEKQAALKAYNALGIIGRLEFDLKQAKEAYVAAESAAEQKRHKQKMINIQNELDAIENMAKYIPAGFSETSVFKALGKKINAPTMELQGFSMKQKPKLTKNTAPDLYANINKKAGHEYSVMEAEVAGWNAELQASLRFIDEQAVLFNQLGIAYDPLLEKQKLHDEALQRLRTAGYPLNDDAIQNLIVTLNSITKDQFWTDYETQMRGVFELNEKFGNDISVFDSLSEHMSIVKQKLDEARVSFGDQSSEVARLAAEYKALVEESKALNETMEMAQNVGSIVGNAFQSMGEKIVEGFGLMEDGWDGFMKSLSSGVMKLLGMLLANAIAYAIQGAAAGASFFGPGAPVALPVFIAEMVGAVTSAFAAIPKFADGAIAYGPTIGMMGEYPGAKSNPEVIAPLDRLKKLIGGNDSDDITVHGRLIGADLYVSNQRFQKRKTMIQ